MLAECSLKFSVSSDFIQFCRCQEFSEWIVSKRDRKQKKGKIKKNIKSPNTVFEEKNGLVCCTLTLLGMGVGPRV